MIHFFWTGQGFDFSAGLAVRSALTHTQRPVSLLVDEAPRDNENFQALHNLPRLRIEAIRLSEWLSAKEVELYASFIHHAHRADLVRFAVLHRAGGLFLDLDTVTQGCLDDLPAVFLIRDDRVVHVGVMGLIAGHRLTGQMLRRLVDEPRAAFAAYNRIVHLWTALVNEDSGRDVAFLPSEAFFPVRWWEWERLFTTPTDPHIAVERIVVLHHYGKLSRQVTQGIDEGWLRSRLCVFSQVALRALAISS